MTEDLTTLLAKTTTKAPVVQRRLGAHRELYVYRLSTQNRDGDFPAEADARIYALAPDLAARVIALEAENERLGDLFDDICYCPTPEARTSHVAKQAAKAEARAEALETAGWAIVDHDAFDREYLSADLNAKLDALRAALNPTGEA